ncbi:unnamed protein product [Acanthosepion pharaonis]|uniref:Uncharacterized protein n=1 Tax=Acanthosepion pharaonis TaxID=158019 RepID=A0A812EZT5_ACAPH|nr:unnamed protein product [Sepia pharaonis]
MPFSKTFLFLSLVVMVVCCFLRPETKLVPNLVKSERNYVTNSPELADRDAQSVEFNASLEEKDNSTAASVGSTYHEKDHDGGSFSFSFSLFLSTLAFTSTDSFLISACVILFRKSTSTSSSHLAITVNRCILKLSLIPVRFSFFRGHVVSFFFLFFFFLTFYIYLMHEPNLYCCFTLTALCFIAPFSSSSLIFLSTSSLPTFPTRLSFLLPFLSYNPHLNLCLTFFSNPFPTHP